MTFEKLNRITTDLSIIFNARVFTKFNEQNITFELHFRQVDIAHHITLEVEFMNKPEKEIAMHIAQLIMEGYLNDWNIGRNHPVYSGYMEID